jgi:hypothetical protein
VIARRTATLIWVNVVLALVINFAVIFAAATVGIPLWVSVAMDNLGLLIVLANSTWPLFWKVAPATQASLKQVETDSDTDFGEFYSPACCSDPGDESTCHAACSPARNRAFSDPAACSPAASARSQPLLLGIRPDATPAPDRSCGLCWKEDTATHSCALCKHLYLDACLLCRLLTHRHKRKRSKDKTFNV